MGELEIEIYSFEWDDEKNRKNFKKHGIRFENAAWAFLDEFKIDDFDKIHSNDEDRFKIIGRVGKILVVVYTERKEKYRLISARYANKKEVDYYYGQFDS